MLKYGVDGYLFPFCGLPFCFVDYAFDLQECPSFSRSHLLIVDLCVCANGSSGSSLGYKFFQGTSYFLFYDVQCGSIYVEIFKPFAPKVCVW